MPVRKAAAAGLAELERRFQVQVVAPHETRARGARSGAHARAMRAAAQAMVQPSATLTAVERIGIYARMYLSRMHDALAEDYKATAHVLGDSNFMRLVRSYLAHHPSRHYSLNTVGTSLPRFIEGAAWVPRRGLVRDLARLEAAMVDVFHAEPAPLLDMRRIGAIDPVTWTRARLRPIPAFALLELGHDANSIVTAVREGRRPPPPRRHRCFVVVWRRDDIVWRMAVEEPMFATLDALARGLTVGHAVRAAAACWRHDPSDLAPAVSRWFSRWTAEGLIASVEVPARRSATAGRPARRPGRPDTQRTTGRGKGGGSLNRGEVPASAASDVDRSEEQP